MWLCPLLLCLPLSLALSGQPEPEAPEDAGELHCGPQGLQYTVHPLGQASGTPPTLIAWDDHGLLHRLQNDSGCGTRVSGGPGHSLVLEASYGGCYVTEWGSQHIMPVGLEQADTDGRQAVATAKLLKCPIGLPGLDVLGAHLCDSVPVGDRLPCAPAPATPRACKALGCCYNPSGRSCYYGNTAGPAPGRGRREHNGTLRPGQPAAGGDAAEAVATSAFALFRFPFTACGTTRRVTGDQAVYENELVAAQDVRTWSRGSITRDSTFRLRVSCTYPVSSSALPVNVQVSLLPPPLPETQPGALTLELQIAKDGNYSAYYRAGDYPVVKLLRDPIFVEVALRHRTDPDLGLLLDQCWATPGPDPGQQPQWALLVNGCPYAGDNYQTQLIPVFLHCSVSVCQPAGSLSCVACPVTRRRRHSDAHDPNSTAFISSQGPMILLQATEDPSGKLPKYSSAVGDSGALWVAGLSGAVIVGVLGVTYLAVKKRS
ncbi:PREDICTED: zona pellucida sperm-binding protein 4 [Myotis davidii]|uniref:zona pellucida sperm-binding protein 4 n=1 Tax=Myotis davidii TaxID=225400 RepID=UPI0003EC0509|nr:PREDICTED: zona pellucida sperm-binding protein 4 [Myotis davidii]